MTFSCPGRLYAKSLLERGELRKDYEEWFAHSDVQAFGGVYDGFDLDLRSDPVIVVINILRDRNLVFRYSWCATSDQNGRRHIRQEVFLVNSAQCCAMLDGRFVATPNADLKTFSVETSSEEVLGEVLTDHVAGFELKVFARQRSDFELIKKERQARLPRQEKVTPRASQAKIQEGDAMFKFLSALFACGCLVGGWYFWTTKHEVGRLESELGRTKAELKLCRDRIAELQKWVGNRQNFERNVSNMREIFSALKKSVAEAESLMLNIDGASSSVQRGTLRAGTQDKDKTLRKSVVTTNASEKVSEGKSVSQDPKKEGGSLLGGLFGAD